MQKLYALLGAFHALNQREWEGGGFGGEGLLSCTFASIPISSHGNDTYIYIYIYYYSRSLRAENKVLQIAIKLCAPNAHPFPSHPHDMVEHKQKSHIKANARAA